MALDAESVAGAYVDFTSGTSTRLLDLLAEDFVDHVSGRQGKEIWYIVKRGLASSRPESPDQFDLGDTAYQQHFRRQCSLDQDTNTMTITYVDKRGNSLLVESLGIGPLANTTSECGSRSCPAWPRRSRMLATTRWMATSSTNERVGDHHGQASWCKEETWV